MDIRKTLNELSYYYATNRQVGNTTLMKRGTSNFEQKKMVLLINMEQGRDLKIPKNERVTLDTLDKLKGSNLPLAIDNSVLYEILSTAGHRISKLEADKKSLEIKHYGEKAMREFYEETIKEMRNSPFKTLFKSLYKKIFK